MKKSSELTTVEFQRVASMLLRKHYGIDLGDTHLTEESVVNDHLLAGDRPYEVVADHALKMDLDRIDAQSGYGLASKVSINEKDEMIILKELNAL